MGRSLQVSISGGVLAIIVIASAVLNLIIALSLSQTQPLVSLTALFLVAFSFELVVLACLTYYHLFFPGQVSDSTRQIFKWQLYWAGFVVSTMAVLFSFAASIWLASCQSEVKDKQHGLVAAGLCISVLYIVLHFIYFITLFFHTQKNYESHAVPRVMITRSGAIQTPTKESKAAIRSSFWSRDPTLASRACTPTSSRTYSLHSATTRVGTSIRSKIGKGRGSARSSLDLPALPVTDIRSSSPNAFDRYDTSNMDPELRNAVLSSSPMLNRSGLDPIPGSRTVTPNRSLDKVQAVAKALPDTSNPPVPASPKLRQNPNPNLTLLPFEPPPSPPSSPPNFSRPTSRHQAKASMTGLEHHHPPPRTSASMTDLIHPLFRPNSPSPPQILTSGTMVTASPLANQPITPKTLSRLRSDSQLRHHKSSFSTSNANIPPSPSSTKRQSAGQWRTMPNPEASYAAVMAKPRPRSKSHSSTMAKRPTTAGSIADVGADSRRPSARGDAGEADDVPFSNNAENDVHYTSTVGSPGPSIADEDDLPPILPGFVLSAGSRSSLVGYGKRKSVKRASAHLSFSQL